MLFSPRILNYEKLSEKISFDQWQRPPVYPDLLCFSVWVGLWPSPEGAFAHKEEDFMEFKTYKLKIPKDANVILGQTHFIKTAEDLYEVLVGSVPGIKFGLAFCEASGPCLVRAEGNDEDLKKLAAQSAQQIGAGHSFIIYLKNAFPINVLNAVKDCPEVCSIFCATANPVELIMAETEQGKAVLGVVDGFASKGIESEKEAKDRKEFLRMIGYKL